MKTIILPIICLFFLFARAQPLQLKPQASGTQASLRGISAVSEQVAWCSGSGGTVLRTIDGGATWQSVSPPDADSLDFRDIQAFSATEAVVMNAGFPGLILHTTDGGNSWQVAYRDLRPGIFLDAMAFWADGSGLAFGDALEGRIVMLYTGNKGATWEALAGLEALPEEGGYAASGTCLATYGDSLAWLALGTPVARILYSRDRGITWQGGITPLQQSASGSGVFSLAFNSPRYGIAVGGNYRHPNDTTRIIAVTRDGGINWHLLTQSGMRGYRSVVAPVPGSRMWLAAGPNGVDWSDSNGKTWQPLSRTGYHTLHIISPTTGWLCGAGGRIARLVISR